MVNEQVVQEGRCGALEWAVCSTTYPGQQRSGDAFLVQGTAAGALIAVVDGLGHGEEAADAADRALVSLRQSAGRPPIDCLMECHAALRGSRGAAVTLAAVDLDGGRLVWVAVGNVEAALVERGRNGRPTSRLTVPMRGGVVGDRLPPLRESTAPLGRDDVLVWATDGLMPAFLDAVDPSLKPPVLAQLLHKGYARADDDALVLVARCTSGRTAY